MIGGFRQEREYMASKNIFNLKLAQNQENQPENWAGKILFHGTSQDGAQDILTNGIDNAKSTKGYFGRGFYMAEDRDLAQSNYADWAEEDDEFGEHKPGVVLEVKINPNANILDLRNPKHWEIYKKASKGGSLVSQDNFDQIMMRNNMDGLYDNSFGGVVIFNPKSVEVIGVSR